MSITKGAEIYIATDLDTSDKDVSKQILHSVDAELDNSLKLNDMGFISYDRDLKELEFAISERRQRSGKPVRARAYKVTVSVEVVELKPTKGK